MVFNHRDAGLTFGLGCMIHCLEEDKLGMNISKIVKRSLITVAIIVVIFIVAHILIVLNFDRITNHVVEDSLYSVSNEAQTIHFSSFIVDLHSDALMWNRDLLDLNKLGHVDLPRLVDGGLSLQVFSAGTNFPLGPSLFDRKSESWPDYYTFHAIVLRWPRKTFGSQLQRALYMADRLHDFVARSDGQLRLIRTLDDLEDFILTKSKDKHPIGGLLSLEGAHALDGELSNLEVLYNAGFRIIGLAHFIDNPLSTAHYEFW